MDFKEFLMNMMENERFSGSSGRETLQPSLSNKYLVFTQAWSISFIFLHKEAMCFCLDVTKPEFTGKEKPVGNTASS